MVLETILGEGIREGRIELVAVSGPDLALAVGLRGQTVVCATRGGPGSSSREAQAHGSQRSGSVLLLEPGHLGVLAALTGRAVGLSLFSVKHEPVERRLLAVHEDGVIRVWTKRGRSTPHVRAAHPSQKLNGRRHQHYHQSREGEAEEEEWRLSTVSCITFRGPILNLSYEEVSGRLVYVEEMREDGGGPPERLRVISRDLVFNAARGK